MRGFGKMAMVLKKNKLKISFGESVGSFANYLFLALIGIVCLVPFLYVISVSFTSENSLGLHGTQLIPGEFSLSAYKFLFANADRLVQSYFNTILVTIAGTVIGLIVIAGVAYPLSKKELPFRTPFMMYVLFSMLFGGGLIPLYIIMKSIGLYDNYWALILPGIYSSWNMILMRNFFMSLPTSLEESALIDGANEIQVLVKIMLPLSRPIMATLFLFMAVGYWNNWFNALLFMPDPNKWPIMMFLKEVLQSLNVVDKITVMPSSEAPPSQSLQMAVVVACTLPIICVYPFLQKYFVRGILMGSIKG